MKIISSVSIYFNNNVGYIICPQHEIEKTMIMGEINLIDVVHINDEEELLGKSVLKNMAISTNYAYLTCEEVDNNHFYKNFGYKNFKSFSKNFEYITVTLLENSKNYLIEKWNNNKNGSYTQSKKKEDCIEVPQTIDSRLLSKNLKKMFKLESFKTLNSDVNFTTVYNSNVSYHFIDDFDYDDIGDGHTDAYQIYVHDTYDKNYIGFMIDSGYDSFSSEDIQSKWKQYYGDFNTFDYQKVSNAEYYTKIIATTNELEIQSYLFKDGEGTLELIFEIDLLTTPEEEQGKIRHEFISLVESVKLNNK